MDIQLFYMSVALSYGLQIIYIIFCYKSLIWKGALRRIKSSHIE